MLSTQSENEGGPPQLDSKDFKLRPFIYTAAALYITTTQQIKRPYA